VLIELWSDFACPWCALGLYRLDAALERFEHGDAVTVVHRAFELDPGAPAHRTQTLGEVLAAKYGMSPEQVHAGHEHLAALGREVGMEYHFDRIQLGNTFDAHRLTRAARGTVVEDALVKRLFSAYFTEGELLSDPGVLLASAEAAGMSPDVARSVLESDAHAADVRADERTAREAGITGVPYFVIGGGWAVPGAQDVDTLLLALSRAWERSAASASAPAGPGPTNL
jgi:predicted DsbA family dithiol-disulfide isomerase